RSRPKRVHPFYLHERAGGLSSLSSLSSGSGRGTASTCAKPSPPPIEEGVVAVSLPARLKVGEDVRQQGVVLRRRFFLVASPLLRGWPRPASPWPDCGAPVRPALSVPRLPMCVVLAPDVAGCHLPLALFLAMRRKAAMN